MKKDLYFDPELWNLIALRTNCLKLMTEKGVGTALEEIMEDKWISNYCTKELSLRSNMSGCQKEHKGPFQGAAKRRHQREDRHDRGDSDAVSKRLRVGPGRTRLSVDHTVKKRGNQGSRPLKDASSEPLRRSFWQLDRLQDIWGHGEHRRITRLSEKNPPKRRIRTPKWLLEDSGTLAENNVPTKNKKHKLKLQKHRLSSAEKKSETSQIKNSVKHKPSVNSDSMTKENHSKHAKEYSLDCDQPASPPHVILELSLPDNELMGTFNEDTCNRQRGFPQVLLYKPTVKLPATSQPVKAVHGKEVILRARDASMFVQQLHCYARRLKGKGNGLNIQSSVSTITRSSVQGSPLKGPQKKLSDKSQMPAEATEPPVLENVLQAKTVKAGLRKASTAREQPEKPATSKSMEAANAMEPPVLDKFPPDISTEKVVENNTGEHTVRSAVIASQTSAELDVTDAPVLEKVQQVQPREHCEESTVEMKVTIASKSPATGKVSQSSTLDKVSKSEVLELSTGDSSQMVPNEEIPQVSRDISNSAADESLASQSFQAHGDDKQLQANALPSHDGVNSPKVSQSISEVVISAKPTKRHVSSKNDASLQKTTVTTTSPDSDRINDISALTLVTEMVTELTPETQTHKLPAPEDSVPKDKPQAPHKTQTTSSCSVHEPRTSAVTDDSDPEISENGEPIETEESRLEYCCTFCNKVFKGSRVVAHAMFHYRKDECMFCGTIFRDDLLAMMHLSDHIEKLKKSKDTTRNKTEKRLSEAKVSIPKTSAKAKSNNLSSGHRSRGRPRKSDVSSKSVSLPESASLASRKLRSDHKPLVGLSLREKKQYTSGHLNSPTSGHKLNGHFGKKKELERLTVDTLNSEAKQPCKEQRASQKRTGNVAKNPKWQESQEEDSASSLQVDQQSSSATKNKTKTLHVPRKEVRKIVEEKHVEPQEKLCCPVDGCTWFTDLSKNRVRLLYHALDDHHGEIGPLKLAFRIGNNKCSICMRVLWSFDHFLHHVERHRLSPRHPCLHQGCTARFKTGIEMRRHTRKHSPLQAACCLPGCSQLFICLWALNLHEREHYASKPIKPDNDTNKEACDKDDLPSRKKLLNNKPNDKTATTTVNKPISRKSAHKPRGQAPQVSSAEMHAEAVSPTNARLSVSNRKTTGSQVLKNPSRKNTSAQMTGPMQRLRQRFRKIQGTKQNLVPLKSHKVVLSSHNVKVRHKFVNKQMQVNPNLPKKRGRPPKSKKGVRNEKPAGQHNKTVKATFQPEGPKKAAEVSNVIKKLKEKLKRISQNTQTHVVTASTAENCKGTADKTQEAHTVKAKKRPPAEEDGSPTGSGESKKQKIVDEKAQKEPEASKTNLVEVEAQPTESEECGKDLEREAGNTESPQELVTVPENSSDETTVPPNTSAENTEIKLHTTNGERKGEKKSRPASDKKNKKPKNATKTGEPVKRGRPRKDASRTSSKKAAKSSSDVKQVEAKAGKSAVETTKASPDSTASALTAAVGGSLNELTAPSTTPKENGQKKAKKEKIKKSLLTKNMDSDKVSRERKGAKEADTKTAKKKMKVQGLPTVTEEPESSIKEVLPPATLKGEEMQSSVDGEQKTSVEMTQSDASNTGHSSIVNGETKAEDVKNKVCMETLAEYSKKPYLRPPPTVYLDERYTTMPKRRKEISFFLPSHSRQDQEKSLVALQRQRCANCFTTFNSAEELQHHLQLQKCSNLFGFDSDDEVNSAVNSVELTAIRGLYKGWC